VDRRNLVEFVESPLGNQRLGPRFDGAVWRVRSIDDCVMPDGMLPPFRRPWRRIGRGTLAAVCPQPFRPCMANNLGGTKLGTASIAICVTPRMDSTNGEDVNEGL
jgi:hypothetical protein